jgi:hypothetical protein
MTEIGFRFLHSDYSERTAASKSAYSIGLSGSQGLHKRLKTWRRLAVPHVPLSIQYLYNLKRLQDHSECGLAKFPASVIKSFIRLKW